MFTLKSLRLTGYIEGTSLLVLLFIAMPVKYMLEQPILVSIFGTIHGFLFIWYVVVLAHTIKRNPMPWWAFPLGFIGAILPGGPFVFEGVLARTQRSR